MCGIIVLTFVKKPDALKKEKKIYISNRNKMKANNEYEKKKSDFIFFLLFRRVPFVGFEHACNQNDMK